MNQAALSYDQAPPFGLPLRFFLTAPLLLMLAALGGLATVQAWTASRWSGEAAALTHLITLGFLGQVMMGALLQMLPVVIGSPVPWPRLTASLGHLGLTAGTLLLAAGLGWSQPSLVLWGMATLGVGWLPFLLATAVSLSRAHPATTATLYPMRQAWFALVVTLALGVWLGGGLAGVWSAGPVDVLTGMHAAWGLLGWVLILVIGVAYQVVPMLQITPAYPLFISRWLTWMLLAGIAVLSLGSLLPSWLLAGSGVTAWLLAGGAMAGFAFATLYVQQRRRRKLPDVTLDFWRLAMTSLLLLVPLPLLWGFLPEAWRGPLETSAGLLFLLGFAASVVSGMLYKIVPFLAWFHLQTQTGAKAGTIPNMKAFVPDALARRQLHLHLAAVLLLLPAPWLPPAYAIPGLLLLAASAYGLWLNLLRCVRLFRRYGGRFG